MDLSFLAYAFLVFYFLSGHILGLWLMRKLRPAPPIPDTSDLQQVSEWPAVSMIVPTLNEEDLIEKKLSNLAALDYPPSQLTVYIADGSTEHATTERVQRFIEEQHPPFKIQVLRMGMGKIRQLNETLQHIESSQMVLITDADAMIKNSDALKRAIALFLKDSQVGLVGGWSGPARKLNPLPVDWAYWDKQNRLRYLETISFSSSIVVAPFYLFPRHLLASFPADCVADDVYISLLCHILGRRIIYCPDIQVEESRFPTSLSELFWHKFRKGNAYTIELLRVMYRLPYMSNRVKFLYGNKLLQFFLYPFAFGAFFLETFDLLAQSEWSYLFFVYSLLFLTMLGASFLIHAPPGKQRGGLKPAAAWQTIQVFVLTFVILMINIFTFPFFRQDSIYPKTR
jgi:cellulose synthase/poly-beta-1,6-N-acetylglucosamine synthase-like glycosyltransferase